MELIVSLKRIQLVSEFTKQKEMGSDFYFHYFFQRQANQTPPESATSDTMDSLLFFFFSLFQNIKLNNKIIKYFEDQIVTCHC